MGKNNRARRKAKAKQRTRRGTPRSRGEHIDETGFGLDPDTVAGLVVSQIWFDLIGAVRRSAPTASQLAAQLAAQPPHLVQAEIEDVFAGTLGNLWEAGWQPAELRREVRRSISAGATRLIELAILGEEAAHPDRVADERWTAQLRDFGTRRTSLREGWLSAWRRHDGVEPVPAYLVLAEVLVRIASLPELDVLIAPPGSAPSARTRGMTAASGAGSDPMLDRIRKLLAKAEATDFEAEASAFTEKAQELMTRHAIDVASLTAPSADDVPRTMRLPLDAPYADGKSVLLTTVARANRCRSAQLHGLDLAVVMGHEADLRLTELLFTSLLVQAQNALREAGRDPRDRRSRSSAFRSSFFLGFAARIGERLTGVNAEVLADVDRTEHRVALPVLRGREDAVEDAFDARFGESLTAHSVRGGYDYAGQALGRRAADEARLDSGELLW